MHRNITTVILVLLMVTLVAIAILGVIYYERITAMSPAQQPQNNSSAAPVVTPEHASAKPAPTEMPTAPPVPTPAPTPVPTSTPAPTATPTPVPTTVPKAEGEFRSNTGALINLIVRWKSYTNDTGDRKVDVKVFAESYSLQRYAGANDIKYSLDAIDTFASAPDIFYYNDTVINEFQLDERTLSVSDSGEFPFEVEWTFNGSYGNRQLITITAKENITIY